MRTQIILTNNKKIVDYKADQFIILDKTISGDAHMLGIEEKKCIYLDYVFESKAEADIFHKESMNIVHNIMQLLGKCINDRYDLKFSEADYCRMLIGEIYHNVFNILYKSKQIKKCRELEKDLFYVAEFELKNSGEKICANWNKDEALNEMIFAQLCLEFEIEVIHNGGNGNNYVDVLGGYIKKILFHPLYSFELYTSILKQKKNHIDTVQTREDVSINDMISADVMLCRTFLPNRIVKNIIDKSKGTVVDVSKDLWINSCNKIENGVSACMEFRDYIISNVREEDRLTLVATKLILSTISPVYIEGVREVAHCAKQIADRVDVNRIYSSGFLGFVNPVTSMFIKYMEDKNVEFYNIQHSGMHSANVQCSRIEKIFFNHIITWGWRNNDVSNDPVGIVRPYKREWTSAEGKERRNKQDILYVTQIPMKFDYVLLYDNISYANRHFELIDAIEDSIRSRLSVRLFYDDYKRKVYQRQYKKVILNYAETQKYLDNVRGRKLVIVDHFSSAYFETLGAGVPVVIYEAMKYLDETEEYRAMKLKLHEMRLLSDCAEEVSEWIGNIDEYIEWWKSIEVQDTLSEMKKLLCNGLGSEEDLWYKKLIS